MITLTPDQRTRLIYTGLLTFAVVAAFYFGVIRSQLQAQRKCQQAMTMTSGKLREANRLLQMADQYQQDFTNKKGLLDVIEDGMASGGDLYSWMIRSINRFKAGYAVEIPSYSAVRVSEVGMLPNFPYSAATCLVSGSAYYHDFGKFVAEFENHFPYMRIQNLELSSATGPVNAEEQEKLEFKMEIVALVAKPPVGP